MKHTVLFGKHERPWVLGMAAWLLCLACISAINVRAAEAVRVEWFPDQSDVPHFVWSYQPCEGCRSLAPKPEWRAMTRLAGLEEVRFMLAPDEANGSAYSVAPDVVVISPSALKLNSCQLAFVIGHEIVHIAQRHFDEDALILSVFEGKGSTWTRDGGKAMALLEGNFGLALKMSDLWQQQEQEADWIGALLAAHACSCNLDESALPYLAKQEGYGGGLMAAHPESGNRVSFLEPFRESAQRLARRQLHADF